MKCPVCERGNMVEINGLTTAFQCGSCGVVVNDKAERTRDTRHPWRRGYKRPLDDTRVSAMTAYVRTKEDKA